MRRTNSSAHRAFWAISLVLVGFLGGDVAFAAEVIERTGNLPEFSWDTVPVYLHFGKNENLSDEEVRFVATHSNFVCLEKGHGLQRWGSTEAGIEHDAARLKQVNPKLKVLYYWNTFLDYPMYDAHEVYAGHPEWWLRELDGSLDKKQGRIPRYDLSNPTVRAWWVEEVRKAVVDGSCDGVFMDAFPQIAASANVRLWGQAKYDAIQQGLIETIRMTRRVCGPGCILMFNGIRNTDQLHLGTEYLPYTDAATIEHFDQFASCSTACRLQDLEAMATAGRQGKAVVLKGWPGFNWLDQEQMARPHEALQDEARRNITFPLACYLVAARPHSYFGYSWGYRDQHGSLVRYAELERPLGPPLGDAERDGSVFTRSFEHVDVWVDVAAREARLLWK